MDHHKGAWFAASPHDDETLFIQGMFRIWNYKRILIIEYGFCLLE